MLRPGEDADEPAKHQLKAPLGFLRRQLRDWWLFSNDELQFGDQVDHQPSVRTQGLQQDLAPSTQLGVALGDKRPDEVLKRLHERPIRDVALVSIELP